MIFDRGAGFYFDEFKAIAARFEDIYADQNILRFEGRLEDRCTGLFCQADAGCALRQRSLRDRRRRVLRPGIGRELYR